MKIYTTFLKTFSTAFIAIIIAGCFGDDDDYGKPAFDDPPDPVSETIVDVAVADGNFTTLVAALQATDLDDVLADTDASFTVFAPTDDAFALLGQDTIDALLADTDTLRNILLYHVVSGAVDSTAAVAAAGTTVETANEASIALSLQGEDLFVNFSKVTLTDIEADNGIIHVIDAVMMPPVATEPSETIAQIVSANENFSTLLSALQTANLDAVLADEQATFTVLAPTNDAFAKIPESVLNTILADGETLEALLLQHVVAETAVDAVTAISLSGTELETASGANIPIALDLDGRTLQVGGATVSMTDIHASNGIIHVIDSVIVGELELPLANIVEVAAANGNFTTLVAALEATELDDVLADGNSTYTVFAPTDEAFSLLGQEVIDALLEDTDTLSNILLYHVLPGSVNAEAAMNSAGSTVETANEANIALSLQGDNLFVNLSLVTLTDIEASNGIIHVIDAVLTPPEVSEASASIAAIVSGNEEFSTLLSALQSADLATLLGEEAQTFTVFAPTDAAFEKIPAATLNAILDDADTLTALLLQHVVAETAVDSITALSLSGTEVETASGASIPIAIDAENRSLMVGAASVTDTDIQATNGIIHVIDTVIVGELELPSE